MLQEWATDHASITCEELLVTAWQCKLAYLKVCPKTGSKRILEAVWSVSRLTEWVSHSPYLRPRISSFRSISRTELDCTQGNPGPSSDKRIPPGWWWQPLLCRFVRTSWTTRAVPPEMHGIQRRVFRTHALNWSGNGKRFSWFDMF